jgi:molybdopterin-guanine dinucleotide biosynthesis protein B
MKVLSVVRGCAGKTETVRPLVAEPTGRRLRVSTIKRLPDTVDLEKPGSGTWRHREAGAEEVILDSTIAVAPLQEMPTEVDEPDVGVLLARLAREDIVFLQRFRRAHYPRLDPVQPERDRRPIALHDPLQAARCAYAVSAVG